MGLPLASADTPNNSTVHFIVHQRAYIHVYVLGQHYTSACTCGETDRPRSSGWHVSRLTRLVSVFTAARRPCLHWLQGLTSAAEHPRMTVWELLF